MMKSSLVILAVVALAAACGDKPQQGAPGPGTPRLVKVLRVSHGDTPGERRYSGEVRARHETILAFRVGGKMNERLVDAGARVRPGQPLARMDPADARLAASQAEANAALAEADLKRAQDLKERNFVSQAALDARVAAAKAASAQAQLAKNQAAYTTLVADAPGVVAAVLAEPGQVVAAGQGVFRLARDGEREVAISLPEAALGMIRSGTAAVVTLWAGGRTYKGSLREIAPVADPATRTFPARIAIAGAERDLPLGMTATVEFPTASDARIVVPLSAIFQQGDRHAVWVVGKESGVELRPIEVERYGDDGAVLRSGLNVGETIVAAGAFKLTAGEKVRIVDEAHK